MARWRVVPVHTPRLVRRCTRCDRPTLFACADAFRVNASGRRLDAWLLYRCIQCDETWKAPLHERVPVDRLDRARLDALSHDDLALAWACAFDESWLGRLGVAVDREVEVTVERIDTRDPARIEIELPYPVSIRLDRLLARELSMSRTQLWRRVDDESIVIAPGGAHALRRPVSDGLVIVSVRLGEDTTCRAYVKTSRKVTH